MVNPFSFDSHWLNVDVLLHSAVAGDLLRTVEAKNRALLKKERERLEHERDCALLRRREAHENLLAVLAVEGWQDSLRKGAD